MAVDLAKWKRTLQREFMRSPAKTGTLLAMLPVAGYFIVPLFVKTSPTTASSTDSAPVSLVAPVVAAESTAATSEVSWRQLATLLAEDARMHPTAAVGPRDPFRPVASFAKPEDEGPNGTKPVVDPRQTPQDFGLQLTATIVGQTRRLATINGHLYPESAEIPVPAAATAPEATTSEPIRFTLRSVAKDHVTLERDGKQFELKVFGLP